MKPFTVEGEMEAPCGPRHGRLRSVRAPPRPSPPGSARRSGRATSPRGRLVGEDPQVLTEVAPSDPRQCGRPAPPAGTHAWKPVSAILSRTRSSVEVQAPKVATSKPLRALPGRPRDSPEPAQPTPTAAPGRGPGDPEVPIVIATILRVGDLSGVQTHLTEFVRYLNGRHSPVGVVTAFSNAGVMRLAAFGLRRLVEPFSGSAAVTWYRWTHRYFLERALRRRLASMEDAVVYCQCPVSAFAALRARRDARQRVVLAVHFLGSQADEWVNRRKIARSGATFHRIRELERRTFDGVDSVVFVSNAARTSLWLGELGNVPTVTIPNFVTPPVPVSAGAHTADLVSIGTLEPHKNHAFLLDTVAAAKRLGHRFTLDIMGEGSQRRALVRRSRQLGIDDQVCFLGAVPEPARLLGAYQAYVHAARREAMPLSIIEAMSAGLPVVAAPVGGIAQLFDEAVEGYSWTLERPREAADVLIRLMSDDAIRAKMGAAARHRVRSQFDSAVVCPALHQFLVATWATPERPACRPAWAPPLPIEGVQDVTVERATSLKVPYA